MQNFVILAGLPKSGINACAWLLKQSGYTVGIKQSPELTTGEYDPSILKDRFLSVRYAPFVQHGRFTDCGISEISAEHLNELNAAVALIVNTTSNFAIADQSFLYVIPQVWSLIKNHARLVVVNRAAEEMAELYQDSEGFEEEYTELQTQIETLKTFFANEQRPVLELAYSSFQDSNATTQLCSFAAIQPQAEILDLSWLDTIIEAFNQ